MPDPDIATALVHATVESGPRRPVAELGSTGVSLKVLERSPVLQEGQTANAAVSQQKTGSHLWSFHSLLTRMPIRKTTKSPSSSAATRLAITVQVLPGAPYSLVSLAGKAPARFAGDPWF